MFQSWWASTAKTLFFHASERTENCRGKSLPKHFSNVIFVISAQNSIRSVFFLASARFWCIFALLAPYQRIRSAWSKRVIETVYLKILSMNKFTWKTLASGQWSTTPPSEWILSLRTIGRNDRFGLPRSINISYVTGLFTVVSERDT